MFNPTQRSAAQFKILHIWYADYPWDVRVEKIIAALNDAGMVVHLVARNIRNLPSREKVDGAEVHRLKWIRTWARVCRLVNVVSSLPAFLNPRWILHIYRVARMTLPDLILVRDLPLAPAAIWVGRLLRIPVVVDMAENYPGFLRTLRNTGALRGADVLVRNPWLAALVERYVIRRAQAIICVIEESAQRLKGLGVPESKLTVVRNTPRVDNELASATRTKQNDVLTIVYLGLIERHRGVQDLVRAVFQSQQRGLQLRLIVIGDGASFSELRGLARDLGVLGNGVELLGRIENRLALDIVSRADIGAIPHMPCDAWDATIPNKLFDYMSLGLPVITSNVRPVERIVLQEACGLAYEWGNIDDLCAKLDTLRSSAQRQKMGEAGRRAVQSKYHWSNDGGVLSRTLRAVHHNYQSARSHRGA
jgi:glycosyltransferase involved in cell wall biosynthesis